MKTTLVLDDDLLREARRRAEETGVDLRSLRGAVKYDGPPLTDEDMGRAVERAVMDGHSPAVPGRTACVSRDVDEADVEDGFTAP